MWTAWQWQISHKSLPGAGTKPVLTWIQCISQHRNYSNFKVGVPPWSKWKTDAWRNKWPSKWKPGTWTEQETDKIRDKKETVKVKNWYRDGTKDWQNHSVMEQETVKVKDWYRDGIRDLQNDSWKETVKVTDWYCDRTRDWQKVRAEQETGFDGTRDRQNKIWTKDCQSERLIPCGNQRLTKSKN